MHATPSHSSIFGRDPMGLRDADPARPAMVTIVTD
jgi:hypothetical protein